MPRMQRRKRHSYARRVPRKKPADEHVLLANRVKASLVERLDALVDAYKRQHPNRYFTRSDLVRELLADGADRMEAALKKAKPG